MVDPGETDDDVLNRLPGAPVVGDPSFDRYARMVQRYLDVPVATVTLVEPDRQVFPGQAGLREPHATTRETPIEESFCRTVVATGSPLVVEDARLDERVCTNPAIETLDVVAYAGWPLLDEHRRVVGSLCAMDSSPRRWTREDLDALADLADTCSAELVFRSGERRAREQAGHARLMSQRSRVLLTLSEALAATRTLDDIGFAVEQVAVESLGCLHAGIWLALPTGAGGEDQVRYVSDPTRRWASATRNAVLSIDTGNPVGETLQGDQPLFFARREDQNARYPALDISAQVGEARAFLPLSAGEATGTLALVWAEVREPGAEERLTMGALASYVAQALQRALLLEEREQASRTLQNAMLTRLPTAEGMQVTARYRPAASLERVGGDWYDAVVTPRGEINLMIGDVMGHDLAAAAVMGELRSMLRALAWVHPDSPAANVALLDQAVASFEMPRFASLAYLRVDPADGSGSRTVRWTNAGHFPPLLVHPDGTSELLDDGGPADLLLGIDPRATRRNQTARLPEGATLLLYTDGLVERRGESLDVGVDRLRQAAATRPGLGLDDLLDALIEDLVGGTHEDDVAALAVRFG